MPVEMATMHKVERELFTSSVKRAKLKKLGEEWSLPPLLSHPALELLSHEQGFQLDLLHEYPPRTQTLLNYRICDMP